MKEKWAYNNMAWEKERMMRRTEEKHICTKSRVAVHHYTAHKCTDLRCIVPTVVCKK